MRSKPFVALLCTAAAALLVACGGDDTAADDTAVDDATPSAEDGASGADTGAEDAAAESGDGGGTLNFQGVTYDLDDGWCGSAPEGGRQWQGWDADDVVEILVRDGGEPPRYSINLLVDGDNWRFDVVGSSESEEAVEAAAAIDATETSLRGEGLTVWPAGASPEEQDELAETLDFDYSC